MLFPLSSVEQMGRVCGDRFWMPFRIISFWVCVVDAHYSRLGEAILMGVCFCGGGAREVIPRHLVPSVSVPLPLRCIKFYR